MDVTYSKRKSIPSGKETPTNLPIIQGKQIVRDMLEPSFGKEFCDALLNTIPSGIIVIDKNSETISYANLRAVEIFGFDPSGLSFREYALNMARARKLDYGPYLYDQLPLIVALTKGRTIYGQEILVQKQDKSDISLSVNATPVINKKGEIIGALAVFEEITERKQAERDLESAKEQYAFLFNSVSEGFAHYKAIYDSNGKLNDLLVVEINVAGAKCSGKTREEQIGKTWRQVWVGIEDSVFDSYRKVDQIGEQYDFEHFSNLTNRWYTISIQKIAEGRFAAVFMDITEHKGIQGALEQSEQLYRTLFDNSQDGFQLLELLYDEKGHPIDFRYLQVNSAFELMIGLKAKDVIGKTAREVFPNYEPLWLEIPQKILESGKAQHIESYSTPINKWLDLYYFPYDKNKVGTLFRDITERKKAEEDFRQSEERFFKAFNSNPTPMTITHLPDGSWVNANESFLRLTEYTKEEVIGHTSTELNLFAGDRAERARIIDLLSKQGKVDNIEISARTKTGKPLSLLLSAVKTVLNGQEYAITTQIDLTERKNMERQLKEQERLAAIGATAGMVGHDIRNPLQAITSDVYLLKEYLSAMPEVPVKRDVTESLDEIDRNLSYINKIVADLQDYAKQLMPVYSLVNLYELMADVFRSIAIPEGISASIDIERSIKIETDPTLFQRILTNLIVNALQAMPKGGQLKIGALANTDEVIVAIKDTGVGIPEHVKPKLFTPMMTTKAKGQGFGLAVVKKAVEALGGTITFESQENKGTTFIIRLPTTKNGELPPK